jgi:excisionase family DNA binding protein
MYLSVQLAARRLGVSPHTIRRWTASGVLPCIRTAGGHRRIKQEDVDELARHVAGADGDHLAARLAREREVETLVEASIALTSRLDLAELLGEIARRLTAILDCHFCAVSDYDDQTHMVRVLADFDRQGRRVTDWKPYSLKKFPFSMRLMEEQELAVITVSDPRADPAETAIMRHYGDKTQLLIPLVYQERSVGLLEVLDHVRERRFTRQELRLARALAGLAATALQNATAFALLTRDNCDAEDLRAALDLAIQGLPAIAAAGSLDDVLRETAALARRTLDGLSVVATWGVASIEVTGDSAVVPAGDAVRAPAGDAAGRAATATDGVAARAAGARVVTATAESPTTPEALVVTATLARPGGGDDDARLLRLIATSAVQAIDRLGADVVTPA